MLPSLVLPPSTLLLTDPPYGIGESNEKNLSRGNLARPTDYGAYEWDAEPIEQMFIDSLCSLTRWQIIWGGNFYTMPAASCWLVWDKLNTGDFADCELAWTNLPKAVRIIRHMWNGMLRVNNEPRYHPTQKPLAVISWALQQVPEPQMIFDPFAGSGTTAVAAKRRGLPCICVEMAEHHCEIAALRLQQETLFQTDEPAQPAATQLALREL